MVLVRCCLLLALSAYAHAADTTLTRTVIGGGLAGGVNLHSASFRQLSSFPACCPEYTGGSGLHLGYSFHIAHAPESTLLGLPYVYGMRASAVGLSGMLTDDEELGNIINDQQVFSGLSRHSIDLTYSTIGIEPYVQLQKIAGSQITASIGMYAGFPMSARFTQKEELIQPADENYTFENGSKVRGVYEVDLPDAASPFIATVLGIGYMFEFDAQRTIEPRIEALIGLTNLTSAVQWGVTSVRAGFNVHYRMPKQQVAPPPPPPPPPPIVQARTPVLSSKLMIPEMLPAQLSNVINVAVTKEYVDAAPVLFFAKNSTEVLSVAKPASQLQQDVVNAVSDYAIQNPGVKLTVVGSCANDEEQAVARERASHVMRLLRIPAEQLEMIVIKHTPAEYPELAEEHRSVQFLVNGTAQIFRVQRTRDSIERITPLRIPVGHIVTCDTNCSSNITASIDGRLLRVEGEGAMQTVVADSAAIRSMQQGKTITVRGQVAFESTSASSEQQIISTDIAPRTAFTQVPVGQSANGPSPATLCYFDFNSSTIASFNEQAFAELSAAVAAGKGVELIATTDHLGTDASNADLASKRAAAAVERLLTRGIPKDRITVGTYQSKARENSTPMDRIANRSVKIVIQD